MESVNPVVKANLWLNSKPDWAIPIDLERNYDSAPEDIGDFIQYLNAIDHA